MNVIDVDDLTKVYQTGMKRGNITALNEVSLSIPQGEIFGLLGPNGAGKTTLMKVLLGITRPNSGEVLVMGLPPGNPDSRLKVGYLPENHRFPSYLTGLGLLEITGRAYRMAAADITTRSEELLSVVGMENWGDKKLRKYSKGMLQRVGLAQAMMPDPDLLLLDEPTDGVDPVGKMEIRQVLERIRNEGKTILLNSHLLSEVESVADSVAILSKGRLVRTDTVENLTRKQLQYEIIARIGDRLIDVPEEIGQRISISANQMIVELKDPDNINYVIDALRHRKISIQSVKPMSITLEQSFMQLVSPHDQPGGASSQGGQKP
jgi:ABC-2 type transport system ATP-binding protein